MHARVGENQEVPNDCGPTDLRSRHTNASATGATADAQGENDESRHLCLNALTYTKRSQGKTTFNNHVPPFIPPHIHTQAKLRWIGLTKYVNLLASITKITQKSNNVSLKIS